MIFLDCSKLCFFMFSVKRGIPTQNAQIVLQTWRFRSWLVDPEFLMDHCVMKLWSAIKCWHIRKCSTMPTCKLHCPNMNLYFGQKKTYKHAVYWMCGVGNPRNKLCIKLKQNVLEPSRTDKSFKHHRHIYCKNTGVAFGPKWLILISAPVVPTSSRMVSPPGPTTCSTFGWH